MPQEKERVAATISTSDRFIRISFPFPGNLGSRSGRGPKPPSVPNTLSLVGNVAGRNPVTDALLESGSHIGAALVGSYWLS